METGDHGQLLVPVYLTVASVVFKLGLAIATILNHLIKDNLVQDQTLMQELAQENFVLI
jgi:hypothetical protein